MSFVIESQRFNCVAGQWRGRRFFDSYVRQNLGGRRRQWDTPGTGVVLLMDCGWD